MINKVLLIIVLLLFSTSFAQDQVMGSGQITIPNHIKSLNEEIKIAEDNEDWNAYYQLRAQIISEWQQVNPEVAKLYGNVSDGVPDLTLDGTSADQDRKPDSESLNWMMEVPGNQPNTPLWGDDVMVTGGRSYDISMDISRDGDIYIAVLGRLDGSSTRDSIYFYKSVDGGQTWSFWSSLYAATLAIKKIEVMCLDGFPGSGGDSYLLLFVLFDDGWLRVARTETGTLSWSSYTILGSSGSGYPTDFAVDRNYPTLNYRAICLYDSSNIIKSVRSDPASNGTVWQDAVSLGLVGKDIDLCYGYNGGTYASFNGFNSGNLYVFENGNYADPLSWGSSITLVTGATDTTRHAQIISSRDGIPNNIASVVFELQNGNTYDLYSVTKPAGSSTWGSMETWVVPEENKWPALYSRKENSNQVFRGVFQHSVENNLPPYSLKYKNFNGTSWSQSVEVSEFAVTGLQKPEVGDLDGNTPVFAYAGINFLGVYFDNESWTPTVVETEINPTQFVLEQNYPNPFNPNTSIKFSVPQSSSVRLKVYDIIGNEIATLVNDQKDAGNYEVNFNAVNLSSGVYFYKLEVIPLNGEKSFVQTKKMILMK